MCSLVGYRDGRAWFDLMMGLVERTFMQTYGGSRHERRGGPTHCTAGKSLRLLCPISTHSDSTFCYTWIGFSEPISRGPYSLRQGFRQLHDEHIPHFKKWSATEDFVSRIEHWNQVVSLTVALEPFVYDRIIGTTRRPGFVEEQERQKGLESYWDETIPMLEAVSLEAIEEIRLELCQQSEALDPNRRVHTILRMAKGDLREKLRGQLGGAVLLKTMAEVLRRACERAFKVELPEEDDQRFGRFEERGLKERLYGSPRLLDGDPRVTTEYLRFQRLDYRPRVRWYVEGDTEDGAISSVLTSHGASFVQVVNLRGQVVEKGVLSFRDSLRTDIEHQIFSFVTIDADDEDNTRVLRTAASQDELFGRFFLSEPDFEIGNFAINELEEILLEAATENGAKTEDRPLLSLASPRSGKEVLEQARKLLPEYLGRIKKDREWGQRLMSYAWKSPQRCDTETKRPVVEAVEEAVRTKLYPYEISRRGHRVNPENGRLVELENTES